jgi:hypothetical protein
MYLLGDFVPRTIIHNTTIQELKNDSSKSTTALHNTHNKKKQLSLQQVKEKPSATADNSDSLGLSPIVQDTIDNGDVIERERLLKISTIFIDKLANTTTDTSYQAILAEKIGKESPYLSKISLELWSSPLDYVGYKLNKSKLILYGFTEADDISLTYQGNGELKMEVNGNFLTLRKTETFKPLKF